ncbi:MAG: AAA family ATPase [Candidatus Contendobacter sp.]|nr:AAA family ATPase [Candidatus Contendobacter sp.]
MKILAIRGKNLASLAGEFAIDFREEPLASAGLFAIAGPTGSGKSTLLDALCLALYNNTPRLVKAGVQGPLPDGGDRTITPRNPANVLRRGVGEGFAEVDFVGNDGDEYRARWIARRAGGKASGDLQQVKISLIRLSDHQPVGSVRTETLDEIKQRIGLSFEQFTRAVLLAQNEFAAFLKTDENDRALLLQTLTGLEAYSGISIRAFERAKAEQQALQALTGQLAGQQPLAAELRAQREQERDGALAEAVALEQRRIELDRQYQWHETWQKLKQTEQQALARVQQTRIAQADAAPRQAYFAQVEAVQDARPLLVELDRAVGEAKKGGLAVIDAESQLKAAQQVRQRADEALAKARQAVVDAEQAKTAANPDLDQAKALETAIKTLAPGHAAALKIRNETRDAETTAQQILSGKQAEQQQTAQALQTVQDWLAAHETLQVLAENWSRWEVLFNDAATAQTRLGEIERTLGAHRQDQQQKQQMQQQAAAAFAKAEAAFHAAEARLQTAIQGLASFNAEELAAQRNIAETRRNQLESTARLWTALVNSRTRRQQLDDESGIIQDQMAQAEAGLTQLLAEKPMITARLEQAEKTLKIAEAACAKNVETLRENLETGSPCPVCGALDHPYATGDAPSHALLIAFKNEVAQCRQALESLIKQESAQQTTLNSSRQRLAAIAKEREPLISAIERDTVAWNDQPVSAELTTVADTDCLSWFSAKIQHVQYQLETLVQQESAQRKAIEIREQAQQYWDQAQQRYSAVRDALNTAQTALDKMINAVNVTTDQQVKAAQQRNDRLMALNPAFPGSDWWEAWETNPDAFYQQQQQRAKKWNQQHKQAEDLQTRLGGFAIEIKGLFEAMVEKTAQKQLAADNFAIVDRTLQDKHQQRKNLFNGCPIAEVESGFDKIIAEARMLRQRQEQAAQKARDDHTQAATALNAAQQHVMDIDEALEKVRIDLDYWITVFNQHYSGKSLDLPQLRALLIHDHDWLKLERSVLQKLADDVQKVEATFKVCQSQRDDHERQRANLDSLDVVQADQQQISAALTAARSRHHEAALDLRRDDERRTATATLQDAIVKQAATTEIWEKLNSLIGSSDGKKFRNYAQQFTLEVLLGYANHHLANLSRRYRLERVPESLALMVIDQDMGDECRSVHSLSGGESFLVSLALALGLASLSSNRIRVESLFIDEGFGSLDADTLRVAMDALDQLQAQGRKVGVISHVQEMTERIGVQIQIQRQSGGQSRVEVRNI